MNGSGYTAGLLLATCVLLVFGLALTLLEVQKYGGGPAVASAPAPRTADPVTPKPTAGEADPGAGVEEGEGEPAAEEPAEEAGGGEAEGADEDTAFECE